MRLGVPAYSYPPGSWTTWVSGGQTSLVVANPNSGPGVSADPSYTTIINNTNASGINVIGYVATTYGAKSAAAVQAEIDSWYAFYPNIKGIFFDEANNNCSSVAYYQSLVNYVKSKGGTFATLNFGTTAPVCFDFQGSLSGIELSLMTFENTQTVHNGYTPPAWEASAQAKIWHLVYGATDCTAATNKAIANNVDYFYVTDDTLPNPWDNIGAACWNAQVAAVTAASPTVSIGSPTTGTSVVGGSTVTVTGTATGTSTVNVSFNGGAPVSVPVSGGNWSTTITVPSTVGTYPIVASAGSATSSVSIVTSAPVTPGVCNQTDTQTINGVTVTNAASVASATAGDTVSYTLTLTAPSGGGITPVNDCRGRPSCGPGSNAYQGAPSNTNQLITAANVCNNAFGLNGTWTTFAIDQNWSNQILCPAALAGAEFFAGISNNGASTAIQVTSVRIQVDWWDTNCTFHQGTVLGAWNSFLGAAGSISLGTLSALPANAMYVETVWAHVEGNYVDTIGTVASCAAVSVRLNPSSCGPNLGVTVPCSNVYSFAVAESIPACLTGASWTRSLSNATGSGASAGSGPISDNVNINTGGSATYTITGVFSGTADCSSTATVGGTPLTACVRANAPLDIINTKTPVSTSVAPGADGVFEWTIQNAGPANVSAMPVSDPVPPNVINQSWVLAASSTGTYSGGTSGSGAINGTVSLTSGQFVKFIVTDTLDPAVPTTVTQLVNSASVVAPASDTNPANNDVATGQIPIAFPGRVLSQKTASPTSVVLGQPLSYTITVENTGAGFATANIIDTMPPEFVSWTWTSNVLQGSVTGATAAGNTDINETVSMGPSSKVVYVATGNIKTSGVGTQVVNTLIVNSNSGPNPDPKRVEVPILVPVGVPTVTKSAAVDSVLPGGTIVWTVKVENANAFPISNIKVQDGVPAGISGWQWVASGTTGVTGFFPSGNTGINDTLSIPAGGSVTYVVSAKIACSGYPANIVNAVHFTNSDGVAQPPVTSTVGVGGTVCFNITNTASNDRVTADGTITYTVTVKNNDASSVTDIKIFDPLPNYVSMRSFTAVASTGVTGVPATGAGPIDHTVNFGPLGSVTYTITDTILSSAYGMTCNTVTVGLPEGYSVAAGCSTPALVVKSPDVIVLAKPVPRVIEQNHLLGNYSNSSLCVTAHVVMSVNRFVKVCAAKFNDWTIRMPLVAYIDGVQQVLSADSPRFDAYTSDSEGCVSGMLSWSQSFDVPPGKLLEIYGATELNPNSGIFVDSFNKVELGTGTLVVSE